MKPRTRQFNKTAAAALANPQIQSNLRGLYYGFHRAREVAASATPGWGEMRGRARAIKAHTLDHLDRYLEMVEENAMKAGASVFFASDADAAARYVVDLARSRGARLVVKGKSMLSEEIDLNGRLAEEGIEPIETDLGEFIVQLAGETPYHIIAPAIHKSRQEVSELFREKLGSPRHEHIADLAQEARGQLRERFVQADMGVTGANFVVAETGTVALVTNEGNGRMCTSLPRVHVAIIGMEKVIPTMEDLALFLRLLIRSATGQTISSYVTLIDGPRRAEEGDGPEEFHLVIVDNGRSRLLADPELRESLYCIRCAACLNACPVYRKVGGHAYGWVYPGPIGAVVSPMLTGLANAKDLPYASSLCGACREVCPVEIDIPRMLLYLRKELAEGQTYPRERSASLLDRVMMRTWRLAFMNPFMLAVVNTVARLVQMPLVRPRRFTRLLSRWTRRGRSTARVSHQHPHLTALPWPMSRWTRHRSFPAIASRPFRARWRDLTKGKSQSQ